LYVCGVVLPPSDGLSLRDDDNGCQLQCAYHWMLWAQLWDPQVHFQGDYVHRVVIALMNSPLPYAQSFQKGQPTYYSVDLFSLSTYHFPRSLWQQLEQAPNLFRKHVITKTNLRLKFWESLPLESCWASVLFSLIYCLRPLSVVFCFPDIEREFNKIENQNINR